VCAANGAALDGLELVPGVVTQCVESRIETADVVALTFEFG
jgi:hypothetical protein